MVELMTQQSRKYARVSIAPKRCGNIAALTEALLLLVGLDGNCSCIAAINRIYGVLQGFMAWP